MSGSTRKLMASVVDGGKVDLRAWVDSYNYKKLDKANVDIMVELENCRIRARFLILIWLLTCDLGLCFPTSDAKFCFDRGIKCTRLW